LSEFYCDIHEVTNAQWVLYLEMTMQKASKELCEFVWKDEMFPEKEAMFPIRCISIREARKFARWCGKRLPTEAEWARCAAGDDNRLYAWGDDWNRGKFCSNKRKVLMPVGSYEDGKSPFGIYDMTGSVWEWTSTKYDSYKGYKPISLKVGSKKIGSDPKFDPMRYVIKGGDWTQSDLVSRLDLRAHLSPSDNDSTVGFRCIKETDPGQTMINYAMYDLEGSCLSDVAFDDRNLYHIECTELTDDSYQLIKDFSYFTICPIKKALTTITKIKNKTQDEPFAFAILSLSNSLESPNLPGGSYVLAYRQKGLSAEDKRANRKQEAQAAKKRMDAEEKKRREKEKEKNKNKPKTEEEKKLEAERKRIEEENERIDAENEKQKNKLKAEMERIGIVTGAKEHVDFPRDKDLIVFLNASNTIVGYIEIDGYKEQKKSNPILVDHSSAGGNTHIELDISIVGQTHPRFIFDLKILENPF